MACDSSNFLPWHREEMDALLAVFPDRTTILSAANAERDAGGLEQEFSEGDVAAASSNDACAVVKISVPLNFPDSDRECVIVEAWLDAELEQDDRSKAERAEMSTVVDGAGTDSLSRPAFERTASGRRLFYQFPVIELPPLELTIILASGYPKYREPDFVLCSAFMSNVQKTAVCGKLDELAAANAGQPIILSWIDWLQNECLRFLGVSTVALSSQDLSEESDLRIGDMDADVMHRIERIIRHDVEAERKQFTNMDHECPVCFDTLPGSEFSRVDACRHHVCHGCLRSYVEQSMQDGKVNCLRCPEDKCKETLPVPIIRSALSAEEWRRWETLSLNRALDTMSDLDWCPRCQMPVVRESDHEQSHLAQCAYCYFAFCTECKEAWHQGRNCASLNEKLEALSIIAADEEASKLKEAQRRALERKMNILSTLKIKETCKRCPACRVFIEKNYGCNKVICSNCHAMMCYRCGKQIYDYSHFSDGACPLIDDLSREPPPQPRAPIPVVPEAIVQLEQMLEANPQLRRQLIRCPVCGQRNLKMNRNNHMRCWACHSTFCYLCRQRLAGAMKTHFGVAANRCPQHSDD